MGHDGAGLCQYRLRGFSPLAQDRDRTHGSLIKTDLAILQTVIGRHCSIRAFLETLMEKLLLVAALACQPGDRLIDLSGKLPPGLQFMDFLVSVEPFYTRFYIYQAG